MSVEIFRFRFESPDEFDVLMLPLTECGYSFLRAPHHNEKQHRNSLDGYKRGYTIVVVHLNSPRLFFGGAQPPQSEWIAHREQYYNVHSIIAPYTKEIREQLINNLKHEKDN